LKTAGGMTAARDRPREFVMSIKCDVILQWSATPEELAAVGTALWRSRAAGKTGIYQYLDNQALADLIAGKLPIAGLTPGEGLGRGFHFRLWDETSHDRQPIIDSLRQDIPVNGVEDIVVGGRSWNLTK
jgi:hypothetical protein